MKVDLYEVFLSYFIYFLLYYIMTILKSSPPTRFVAPVTPGERNLGSIGYKDSGHKRESNNMNG